jgi:hypothetical protein
MDGFACFLITLYHIVFLSNLIAIATDADDTLMQQQGRERRKMIRRTSQGGM